MQSHCLIFDLDDTLYPERDFALAGFEAAGAWAQERLGLEGLAGEMAALLDAGHLGPLFKMVLDRHMPDHQPQHLQGLVQAYRDCRPPLALYDDGAWALAHYARTGVPLGLITDGRLQTQQAKVQGLGIAGRFEEIVYTGGLGSARRFHKPHPLGFELIERALRGRADRFVYVGDNPSKDFVAPNAMGWRTVQVVRPGGIHDGAATAAGGAAHHVVTSLRSLPEVLE